MDNELKKQMFKHRLAVGLESLFNAKSIMAIYDATQELTKLINEVTDTKLLEPSIIEFLDRVRLGGLDRYIEWFMQQLQKIPKEMFEGIEVEVPQLKIVVPYHKEGYHVDSMNVAESVYALPEEASVSSVSTYLSDIDRYLTFYFLPPVNFRADSIEIRVW